ncbi:unnamed protein product [Onchocerca ochengi]|uniref:ABC transporter domain-containing protein n=1 Tax=Onchocerca ochengi TaxID=42157 RepID=A0A182EE45_ONCOC|nr:unnamed protein product [Onchocerca ochengi]
MGMKSICKKKFDSDIQPARYASFIEILRYAQRKDYILLTFGVILSVINGAIYPFSAVFFRGMTDALIIGQSNLTNGTFNTEIYTESVLTYVYCYVLLAVLLLIVSLFSKNCLFILSERQAYEIRKRYFAALLRQQMSWYDQNKTGALTNKLSAGIEQIKLGIGDKFGALLQASVHFIVGVIIACYYSFRMTSMMLVIIPLIMMLLLASTKVLAIMTSREMRAYDEAGSVASEVINNIRTVTAFNAQYAEIVRYGTNLAVKGEITPGTVFAVFWAITVGAIRLVHTLPQIGIFTAAKFVAGEIFQTIDLKPKIDCLSPHGLIPTHVKGQIELHNVHFCYPNRPDVKILNNISFTVSPGSTVALVGHSGCGKSTIIGLLLRFYEQQAGKITLDGVPISDLNIEWLRNKIGLVSQEPVVFARTIEENLKLGNEALTENEMIEACKIANAHDFIMKLPNGYKTLIGVGGVQLSGGQKQRIAIARILVRNPKILLFDEATSALDSENEAAVQLALDRVRAGRTTITVAHRLSTIRNADQIIVFKNGEIMEMGLHDELMELNGIYRQIVQTEETEKDDGNLINHSALIEC